MGVIPVRLGSVVVATHGPMSLIPREASDAGLERMDSDRRSADRHVSPDGALRPDGEKLLARKR
jgi:hypothetical protein